MWTRRPTCHPDTTYGLSLSYLFADGNVDLRLVQIGRYQPLTVIDQDKAPFEMHARASEGDAALGRGTDDSTCRRGQVDAVMRPGCRAVQDPLAAPCAGDSKRLQRPVKAACKEIGIDAAGKAFVLESGFLLDPSQQRRVAGFDGRGRQAVNPGSSKNAGQYVEIAPDGSRAVTCLDKHPRRRVAVETHDEPATGRGGRKCLVIDEDVSARPGPAYGVATLLKSSRQRQRIRCAGYRCNSKACARASQQGAPVGSHASGAMRAKASSGLA